MVWAGVLQRRCRSAGQKTEPSGLPSHSCITHSLDTSARNFMTGATRSAVIDRPRSV